MSPRTPTDADGSNAPGPEGERDTARATRDAEITRLEQRVRALEAAALAGATNGDVRWQALTEHAPDHIIVLDLDAHIASINRTVPDLTIAEVLGRPVFDFLPPDARDVARECFDAVVRDKVPGGYQTRYIDHDGEQFHFDVRLGPVLEDGEVVAVISSSNDVTERHRLLERLQHAEKMEAVGKLAGGIAHDFNNLLSVILGQAELLLRRSDEDGAQHAGLREIRHAAKRAAQLTGQLLALSRKQLLRARVLDIGRKLDEMSSLIERVLGVEVDLAIHPPVGTPRVRVDESQLEQVILNLVTNARDAMPKGGRLEVRCQREALDAAALAGTGLPPGEYARIEFSDDGVGMSDSVANRIFDPFFSTKTAGRGTGLGLAAVHGIIEQSGGHIEVRSTLGEGTTFIVSLPHVDERPEPQEDVAQPRPRAEVKRARILVVEDDRAVAQLIERALSQDGFHVLRADNGIEALALIDDPDCHIDGIVSDVVMPRMGGAELLENLAVRGTVPPVVFISGYPEDEALLAELARGQIAFLGKPFSPDALSDALRTLLPSDP